LGDGFTAKKWKSRLIELKTKTEHNNIVKCTSEITETVRDLPEKNTKTQETV